MASPVFRRPHVPTGFSPADLPSPLLLFESDQPVYKDIARTVQATLNGDVVNGLTDFSGNNNHPVTTSTTNQGTLKTNAINGLPSVVFDGTNTFFGFSPLSTIRYAVFVIKNTRANGVESNYAPILGHHTLFDWGRSNDYMLFDGTSSANLLTGTSSGWWNGTPWTVKPTTGGGFVSTDFVWPTSWSFLEIQTAGNVNAQYLSNDRDQPTLRVMKGEWAACYLYAAVPTTTQQTRLQNYIRWKYGLNAATTPGMMVFDGNSHTSDDVWPSRMMQTDLLNSFQFASRNWATSGNTTANNISNYAADIAPLFRSTSRPNNVLIEWEITNDLAVGGASAATAYAHYKTYGAQAKATGWKVVLVDCLDRGDAGIPGTYTADRNTVNANLAADFNVATSNGKVFLPGPNGTYADMLVRISLDPNIGGDGAYSNTTYFDGSNVHLNTTGKNIVADLVAAALPLLP